MEESNSSQHTKQTQIYICIYIYILHYYDVYCSLCSVTSMTDEHISSTLLQLEFSSSGFCSFEVRSSRHQMELH